MRGSIIAAVCLVLSGPPAARVHAEDAEGEKTTWEVFRASAGLQGASPAEIEQKVRDMFPVGIWFDGRVEGISVPEGCVNVPAGEAEAREYYRRTFRHIKEHNIGIIVIPNTPPEYRPWLLDEAEGTGVEVVLEIVEFVQAISDESIDSDAWGDILGIVRRVHEQIGASDALLFYQLIDEPPAQLAPKLRVFRQVLEAVDPERTGFSCLCSIHDKGSLIEEWDPAMLAYDCYPLHRSSAAGDFGPFAANVDTAYRMADGRPLWMVVQACGHGLPGLRIPTPEEIRAMTYLSVAHGARGVFFFLYTSNTQNEHLIGLDELPLQFVEVSRLALQLRAMGPTLLGLERVGPAPQANGELDVQMFRGRDGGEYAVVVNTNVREAFRGTVELEISAGLTLVDAVTGERFAGGAGGLVLELAPGQGRLLKAE